MDKQSFSNTFIQQILSQLPAGFNLAREELSVQLESALQHTLSRLKLVSREEFDIQVQVLQRTRARLEALEAQMLALTLQTPEN